MSIYEAQREAVIDGFRPDGERMTRVEQIQADYAITSNELAAAGGKWWFAALIDRTTGKAIAARRIKGKYGICWMLPGKKFLSLPKAAAAYDEGRVRTKAAVSGKSGFVQIVQIGFPSATDEVVVIRPGDNA